MSWAVSMSDHPLMDGLHDDTLNNAQLARAHFQGTLLSAEVHNTRTANRALHRTADGRNKGFSVTWSLRSLGTDCEPVRNAARMDSRGSIDE
jgi:hypothetical protein